MKIVINKCFGGFSLSPAAVKRMAELQGKPCYFFTHDWKASRYVPAQQDDLSGLFFSAFTVPDPNECLGNDEKWPEMTPEERKAREDRYSEIHLDSRPEDRTSPLLVQVVSELGEKANGACAKLGIVEVPDGVEWEIAEYDGNEHIAERHRTWN